MGDARVAANLLLVTAVQGTDALRRHAASGDGERTETRYTKDACQVSRVTLIELVDVEASA